MAFNDLEVKVSANTRDLDRGLRRARRSQERYARDTERMDGRMSRFAMFGGGGRFGGRGGRVGGFARLAGSPAGIGAGVIGGSIAAGTAADRAGTRMRRSINQMGDSYSRATDLQRQFFDENDEAIRGMGERFNRVHRSVSRQLSRDGGIFGNLMAAGVARFGGDEASPFLMRAGGAALRQLGFGGGPESRFMDFRRQRLREMMQGRLSAGAVRAGQAGEAQSIAAALRSSFQQQMRQPGAIDRLERLLRVQFEQQQTQIDEAPRLAIGQL